MRGALAATLLGALIACGGGAPEPKAPAEPTEGARAGGGTQMVPPEKMDEIERNLARKRNVMSRCLANAIDNKELPRNSKGKVTVEIVIAPNGKADSVKVVRATVESPLLNSCVIDRIKEIQFPDLPQPYPTSYTYAFEAT
jgi:hypothetical protein